MGCMKHAARRVHDVCSPRLVARGERVGTRAREPIDFGDGGRETRDVFRVAGQSASGSMLKREAGSSEYGPLSSPSHQHATHDDPAMPTMLSLSSTRAPPGHSAETEGAEPGGCSTSAGGCAPGVPAYAASSLDGVDALWPRNAQEKDPSRHKTLDPDPRTKKHWKENPTSPTSTVDSQDYRCRGKLS